MSLADLAVNVIVFLAGSASMVGVYLKLSEQWLKNKDDQVKTLCDDRFFSLVESLGTVCEARRAYENKKDDEAITTEEYNELLNSVMDNIGPLDEYTQLNGCLFRMTRKLRNGAMFWILVFLIVVFNYLTAFYIETMNLQTIVQGIDVSILISLGFAYTAVIFGILALHPFLAILLELNSIDEKSESMERIRTWKKRT